MSKKRSRSQRIWELLKKIGLIVGILAGIVTIVKCFCAKDYSEDVKNAVVEIKKQSFVMEQMPDSLLEMPTVKQARELQQQILNVKNHISHIDFAPRDNANTLFEIARYVEEMEKFLQICDEIKKTNNKFSAFIINNPEYTLMFDLGEYERKSNRQTELLPKIEEDHKASRGQNKSPEEKLKQLKEALNSENMLEYLNIQKEMFQLVFDYLNKVQNKVKLDANG